MPLPPLLIGAAAVGQQIGNWIQGRRNTDKTIQANMKLAKYQYKKDLEMWERGNVYNSPEAQMERLRQAGLNPNLVYGSGSAPGASAGQLPKFNAPNVQYDYPAPQIGGALSAYQDFTLKKAQTDNVQEQNKVIKADAGLKETALRYAPTFAEQKKGAGMYLGEVAKTKMELLKQEMEQKGKMYPYQLEYAGGKVAAQELQRGLMKKQSDKLDEAIEYAQKQNDWYLTKMWSQIINQSVGTAGKILPAGQLGKAAKAIPGKNPGMKPRYNSPTSWRDAGY